MDGALITESHPLPFSVCCTTRIFLTNIHMPQSLRPTLVAGRGVLFLSGCRVAVERDNAGIVDFASHPVLEEPINAVLRQFALQLHAHCIAGTVRQAVLHVATVPDDLVDFGLNPLQRIGEFGDQCWPAFGQCVAERCATSL